MRGETIMKSCYRVLLTIAVLFTSIFANVQISEPIFAQEEVQTKEYLNKEDAYIRSGGNASKNYDYETITKAHGAQYEGKGITVINTKYGADKSEIIAAMKFPLPTKEELNRYNDYEFEFHIFKNADYGNGAQSYDFHYATDNTWKENTLTWNNKPAGMNRDDDHILFQFDIAQGDEYETKTDEEKTIKRDISETVTALVQEGHQEMTVFITAKQAMNTSLLLHSKETNDQTKVAKIVATKDAYTKSMLKTMYDEYANISAGDYTTSSYQAFAEKLKEAKIVLDKETPAYQEIKTAYTALKAAYDALVKSVDPSDTDNIAYQKPTRSNLSKDITTNVTDGNLASYWSGIFYPSYVDVDLMDSYELREMKVFVPANKVNYYTIYGSNDGKTYDRLYQKRDQTPSSEQGDTITFTQPCTYRILRVYMEYTQGDDKAYLSEVKAYGTKKNTNTASLREGSFESISGIEDYRDTAFADEISQQETFENIYGIIDRTIGAQYRDWFTFEIAPNTNSDMDYYEISDQNGKIHIKGNKGITITTGLNYYYKNFLNVMISEQTMQVKMPSSIVKVGTAVYKETPYSVRYAYNYCTLSYTYAFFGEEEWQHENDWLALNGVNVVLDLAGQEAIWVKFLMNFGYSFDDAKDWLTGPSYYAWQFMDNMESFGGPVPDQYIVDRVELARSTQRWKNSLGMQTVYQGYAGMVPTNFKQFQPDVEVIKQGNWNGFSRPDMIATDSDTYDTYATLFYEAQEYVYGENSDYYAVDPFHEGGIRPSGLGDAKIAEEVLNSLLDYDANGVWIVQGWQNNPTNELLKGMGDRREDHVLIVDLIKYPIESWNNYKRTSYGSTKLDSVEFNGTSWAWGLLANFGGNPSMHGQMQGMVDDIMEAQKTCDHMVGIGIISEAMYDNPVMYDLIFDLAWADETFNLNQWLESYIVRRYGGTSENAKLAWKTMKDANYNHGVRYTNELFGMKGKAPQDYGTQSIPYGADKLETAFKLLIKDYDKFKDSEGYRYDLTEIMRQMVSNYAVLTYNDVLSAKNSKDLTKFKENKDKFLTAFDVLNAVQETQQEQLAGEWIGKAQDRSATYDDFSKDAFEMNAKSLITSWGSRSSHRSLKDYGWRNYEGMFLDLYKKNWEDYLNKVEKNLTDGSAINTISAGNYFDTYWNWNLSEKEYTRDAKDSPEEIKNVVQFVLDNCTRTGEIDPNIGNKALNRSVQTNIKPSMGKSILITDGKTDTSVTLTKEKEAQPEIIIDLIAEFQLSKINVLLDNTSISYNHYELYASQDGATWDKIASKTDDKASVEDHFDIKDRSARFIKLKAIDSTEITIKEIRVYGDTLLPTLDQLNTLVSFAKTLDTSNSEQAKITQFNTALKLGEEAIKNAAAPDEVNSVYWSLYDAIIQLNLSGTSNVALKKSISAHNDPSGNSARLIDGDTATYWDSGRLSATGKPYEETITPGWAIIDLGATYDIEEIKILFKNNNYWYNYELYASMDQETWIKLGEKKSKTTPNENEDNYNIDHIHARYVKMMTTNIQTDSSNKRNTYQITELQIMGSAVTIDASALETLLLEAMDIELANYTTNTKTTLDLAIKDTNALLNSADINQEQIDEMYETLQAAMDALELKASASLLTQLKAAVQSLEALKKDFTETEFKDAQKAIDEAKIIVKQAEKDADNVSLNVAQSACLALAKAKDELVHNTRLEALRIITTNAEALLQSDAIHNVRPANIQALKDAVNVANALITDESTDIDTIAKATNNLVKAMQELYKIVDKTELSRLIQEAEGLHKDRYTIESWNALTNVIMDAKLIVNNDDATTDAVQQAYDNVIQAVTKLTLKTNKDALKYYLDITEQMLNNINAYVPSTIRGLQALYTKANTIYCDQAASQKDVEVIVNELIMAVTNARLKADMHVLQDVINTLRTMTFDGYTVQSVGYLKSILLEAEEMIRNEEATQEQVEILIIKLNAAKEQLKKEANPSDQQPPLNIDKDSDVEQNDEVKEVEGDANKSLHIANTGDSTQYAILSGCFVLSLFALSQYRRKNKK